MAAGKTTRARFEMTEYPHATCYEGTREELIGRAVVRDHALFADGSLRDRRGRAIRTLKGEEGGRKVAVTWLRERGRYCVAIGTTPEEQEARSAKYEQEREAERRAQACRWQARQVAELGAINVARTMLRGAGLSIAMAFNMGDDPEHPWRFPRETQSKAARLFLEIEELFKQGGFEERRAPVAQADGDFQRFMRRASGSTQ